MADNNLQQDPVARLYSNIKNSYDLPDFSTFKADMSDSNKAKKLHETLVKDGYDMPSFDVFSTDMGLKKKDLGGPISTPTGSQSVSKSFISSLPEQKSIYAPSEKVTSESTVVVQPKEAKLISEANKRGDQITKEAIENSNDLYLKMQNKFGNKVTKETPYIVQNKKELEGDLKNGTLQVVKSPKTGKYVLAHKADIFDSFSKAWDNVLAKQADDRYVASLTPEEKIKHYEAKEALNQDKYLEQAPSGFSGSVGRILGENAEPLIKLGAMGTAAGKAAQAFGASASTIANAQRFGSFLAFATDAGYSGYADNTERVYKSLREQDPNGDKVEQMKKAENAGLIGEASGIGMAAAMSGMFSNLKGAAKTINTKPFVSALETMAKHTAKEGAVQGSVAALNSIVSDLGAKSQGLKIDTGDILTNALDAGSSMAQFVAINSLAMGAATGLLKLPGYVKAQAKGLVSELPREEVKAVYESAESNGILPEGTTDKVINSLNEYDKAKQKLPEEISDEHKAALTGIQEKIDKLEKSKEKLAPQYHARVDDTINSLKDRAVKILDSKNPMAEEVDNILNVKGSEEIAGPPVTETDLIEEVKPKVKATEKETPIEVKTTEEVTPTEVKVTEDIEKRNKEYPSPGIVVRKYEKEGANRLLEGEDAEFQDNSIERTIASGIKNGLDRETIMDMLNANGHVFNMGNDMITMSNYIKNRIEGIDTRPFNEFKKNTRVEPTEVKVTEEVKPTEVKEEPLKENEYYHATENTEILAPSDKGYKKREGANVVGEGIYFGKDKEHLTDRFGKNAIKAELDIKNPLITDNVYVIVDGREIDMRSLSKEDIDFLKGKGYDAIKYVSADRAYSNWDETVVFDKSQIKVKEEVKPTEVTEVSEVPELVKEAPKEEKPVKAYKDLTRNEKRQIINSKFDELIKELKIEKICPT